MSILTSITIIISILIISITNIISGYFKPDVILNRKNNKIKKVLIVYKTRLNNLIKKVEDAIIGEEGVILDDILEDLQTMKKVIDRL